MTTDSESPAIELPAQDAKKPMNPFMALVDAAADLLENAPARQRDGKASPTWVPEGSSETEQANDSTASSSTDTSTPPPEASSENPSDLHLVSPPTPKSSNRSVVCVGVKPASLKLPDEDPNRLSFARVLMDVLMNEEHDDVITFLPDGDAFAILKPKKFADEVMPKHFGIRTLSPFIRKLHRWGFERIMEKKKHEVDVFRHPLFIRGNFRLCDKIKCVGRLVKGPIEQALLRDAAEHSSARMALLRQHQHNQQKQEQEAEFRVYMDRVNFMNQPANDSMNRNIAKAFLLEAAAREQQASLIQQAQQQSSLIQQLRQADAEARQRELLLASLMQQREEEQLLLNQELQRRNQEELLRQQLLSRELANAVQEKRLRELLSGTEQDSNFLKMALALQAAKSRVPPALQKYL